MNKRIISLVIVVLGVCASAWAATKIRSAIIVNSTVDSTPIGASAPSTGVFSTLSSSTYTGAIFNSSVDSSPIGSGSASTGNFTSLTAASLGISGSATVSGSFSSGSATISGAVASGSLSTGSIADTGLTSGACVQAGGGGLLGSTPFQCTTGASRVSSGHLGFTSCTTGGNTYSICDSTVTISPTMPDLNYVPHCQGIGASDPRAIIEEVSFFTTSTVTCRVVTEGSTGVNFQDIYVIAVHP